MEEGAMMNGPAQGDDATVVQFRDVTAAAYRIKKGVKETPLEVDTASNGIPRLVDG